MQYVVCGLEGIVLDERNHDSISYSLPSDEEKKAAALLADDIFMKPVSFLEDFCFFKSRKQKYRVIFISTYPEFMRESVFEWFQINEKSFSFEYDVVFRRQNDNRKVEFQKKGALDDWMFENRVTKSKVRAYIDTGSRVINLFRREGFFCIDVGLQK